MVDWALALWATCSTTKTHAPSSQASASFFVVNWWAWLASPQMFIAAFFAVYYYLTVKREHALQQQINQGRMQMPERPPPETGTPAVG